MLKINTVKYPNLFKRTCYVEDLYVVKAEKKHVKASILGRVVSIRVFGKALFVDLVDVTGKIQIYISVHTTVRDTFEMATKIQLGTILWCRGILFLTKQKSKALKVYFFTVITKPTLQFPTTWFGIKDTHKRYTYRYLDFFLNDNARRIIEIRVLVVASIRTFLLKYRYLEVETPVLHVKAGGADAKPFTTSSNLFKKNIFLRIAPELYLKRLLIAGFERVFEIGKNFRNEGVSFKHSFEFTTVEFYEAYANYKDFMCFVEKLLKKIYNALLNVFTELSCDGKFFTRKFKRLSYKQALITYTGTFFSKETEENKVQVINFLNKHNIAYLNESTVEELQFVIFEKFVTPKLQQPTFVYKTPAKFAPLARCSDAYKNIAERFELYILGMEIADGFSELNDVTKQEFNFKTQQAYQNNKESLDTSYITALKYGLPPAAGVGIGIDRLVMVFSGASTINDVLFFPASLR